MKIKLGTILEPACAETLTRLTKCRDLPPRTAYTVGKVAQAVLREITKAKTKRLELMREHAKKDKAGKVIEKDGKVEWKDKDALEKALAALFDESFKLSHEPVSVDLISEAKLSPEELLAVEFLIET